MSLLEVRRLTKSFGGVHALRGVSFEVHAGEVVAMIGPNGAGKSTCFDVLGGQTAPDAGEVRLAGEPLLGQAPPQRLRRGLGRTFQITATFGSMSTAENLGVALLARERLLWSTRPGARLALAGEARDLLRRVGIVHLADRTCAELSYGDLKRVEVAIALAARPRLLLMDEPTAGMSRGERDELMRLAVDLSRREGVGVLFTEHDMSVVFAHAQRVLVLHQGELIADGVPDDVRVNARVRQVYLGDEDA
ncbi:MAG TPA: ABC transporter ATP-binding protein [Burkholderiales bacterium]|nr:ABC transporter ATP-binding protein [Burkholderiales bacterium]